MATNTSDFFTFSKTAGTAKNLQKPTDGGDNNLWGGYINVDLDTIVGAVNATSDLIADANQNELVDFTATGSAVNHVGITNAATGNGPTIEAKGDDTNIDLNVSGKGTGKLATTSPKITTGINDSNNNELIKVTATGSAVNEITVANAATGNGPTLSATGDDTNIDLNIAGKGSGTAKFTSNIIIPDAGNIGSVSDPDAIAIASDGGLTFNGGIDNSGTISAGTIGGSVVFPAGHILQVVDATLSNVISAGTARTSEAVVATADGQITITSGNKVLVYAQVTIGGVANSNCVIHSRVREGTDTTGTVLSEAGFMNNNTSASFNSPQSHIALDDSPASTTPDYTLTMFKGSGGTSSVNLYSAASEYLKIILMEIKG